MQPEENRRNKKACSGKGQAFCRLVCLFHYVSFLLFIDYRTDCTAYGRPAAPYDQPRSSPASASASSSSVTPFASAAIASSGTVTSTGVS